ncbi:ABC-2 family transporter protein [Candidatus Gottesmanbacteria bacterium]|nr:ABC-2 family transporter protein [Candidatus Gottesmanbacteria bacterium]
MQSFFGLVVLTFVLVFIPQAVIINLSFFNIVQTLVIFILALFLSFYFRMLAGISAFWLTDYSGFEQLLSIIILLLAGLIMPVDFFPEPIKQLALITPFPYMIYYPVISLQGKLPHNQLVPVLAVQLLWITLFKFFFNYFWDKGLRKFAGVGN